VTIKKTNEEGELATEFAFLLLMVTERG